MIPPLDPFAKTFDSVDPANAPTREAIENAMAHVAPREETPGFYLLNDANGRFVIDREIGVVRLADESILHNERNTVHGVRLRVVEPSGATYELDMKLRVTGLVPQMVGAEEFAAIAGMTDETVLTAIRVPTLVIPADVTPQAPTISVTTPEPQQIAWTRFAVAQGHAARTPRAQPRRSFITTDLPASDQTVTLSFDGLPAPFSSHLPWSL